MKFKWISIVLSNIWSKFRIRLNSYFFNFFANQRDEQIAPGGVVEGMTECITLHLRQNQINLFNKWILVEKIVKKHDLDTIFVILRQIFEARGAPGNLNFSATNRFA